MPAVLACCIGAAPTPLPAFPPRCPPPPPRTFAATTASPLIRPATAYSACFTRPRASHPADRAASSGGRRRRPRWRQRWHPLDLVPRGKCAAGWEGVRPQGEGGRQHFRESGFRALGSAARPSRMTECGTCRLWLYGVCRGGEAGCTLQGWMLHAPGMEEAARALDACDATHT